MRRISPTGDCSLYRRSAVRISLCGSTTAIAPIGLSQCSSPLSPVLPSVPAAPLTTLPPCPCLGWVIPCPLADEETRTRHAVVTSAQRSPVSNIAVLQHKLVKGVRRDRYLYHICGRAGGTKMSFRLSGGASEALRLRRPLRVVINA